MSKKVIHKTLLKSPAPRTGRIWDTPRSGGVGGSSGRPSPGGSAPLITIEEGDGIEIDVLGNNHRISHGNTLEKEIPENENFEAIRNAIHDAFGHVVGYDSIDIGENFLRKNTDDIATGFYKFLLGFFAGDYKKGESGAKIDKDGNAEVMTLVVNTLAKIAKATVGQIGSDRFVDGFAGEGFQIWQDILTGRWKGTFDDIVVRNTMTVFELLWQKIRAIGGMLIVSAGNGKIKEVSKPGNYYEVEFEDTNPFVIDDLMRCQVFTGNNIKSYWVRISSVDGNIVRVPASEFDEGVMPEIGDEVVLCGNKTNKLRQNLISISATEDGQPRIDVLNGVKEKNFNGALRVRLGNLDGIEDTYFPADNQPHGDGLYGDNVYLRGTFLLSTGEDIKTKFEIVEGYIRSEIEALRKDLSGYQSFLFNSYFNADLIGWETLGDVSFFQVGGKWIWLNNNIYTDKRTYAAIKKDGGVRQSLFIKNSYILQKNANFEEHPVFEEKNENNLLVPRTFYIQFSYKCIKPGTLKIEFIGADKAGFYFEDGTDIISVNESLDVTEGYTTFEASGLWNGTGDFKLSFTGEVFIYDLLFGADRVSDISQELKTVIIQTENAITQIASRVDTNTNYREEHEGRIVQTADSYDIIYGIKENNELQARSALSIKADGLEFVSYNASGVEATRSKLVLRNDLSGMYMFDAAGNVKSVFEQTPTAFKLKADYIKLEGVTTINGNFRVLEDGSIETKNSRVRGSFETSNDTTGNRIAISSSSRTVEFYKAGDIKIMTMGFKEGDADIGGTIVPGVTTPIITMNQLVGDGRGYSMEIEPRRINVSTGTIGGGMMLDVESLSLWKMGNSFFFGVGGNSGLDVQLKGLPTLPLGNNRIYVEWENDYYGRLMISRF